MIYSKILYAGTSLVLFMSLGGCADYLDRRDGITLSAGDAKEINRTTHHVDPWAGHTARTDMVFNGQRMTLGAAKYEANKTAEPSGGSPSNATISPTTPGAK